VHLFHPESRVIRPLCPGDIVAFPYLDAIGRYVGDDATSMFEWYVLPGGPLCLGNPSTITTAHIDDIDTVVDSGEVVIVATGFDSLAAYDAHQTYCDCDPRLVSPGGAPATTYLELRAERGCNARERVNGFLKHPTVQYQHDPVTKPFRIALTAVYEGRDVAMAVLGRPSGRHNADGQTLELYRFAAHPKRPANTGSWLLSRCCRWATLEGYDPLLTYAGVQNDNEGTMYRAAGFTHLDTTTADLNEWHSRSGRVGGGTYRKRRYRRWLSNHSLEARRPAGRLDAEQSHLTDWGPAHGGGDTSPQHIPQGDLIQTREDTLGRRGGSLSPDAQAFFEKHSLGVNEAIGDTYAPLIACFGYRTPEDALVAGLAVRDHSGEPNPRNNTAAVTLASVAVQTPLLAYPVNTLRALIADAVEWASLHGYATVETRLENPIAFNALNGLTTPVEAGADSARTIEVALPTTPSSA
jgi:GNAT superfamily N-acetyltransferase